MAENKKSFLLYANIIHTVKKLSKEQIADLFLTILDYVNDEKPVVTDFAVDLVFEPIKQQLKIDLKKWDEQILKYSNAGRAGGIKSGEARRKKSSGKKCTSTVNNEYGTIRSIASTYEANEAVIVNVNDNVIKKEKEKSFPLMPKAEDVGELPEIKINAAVELMKITKQTDISKKDVIGLWEVFKTQNLTGKKYHADLEAVHAYFINWIKIQNIGQKTRAPDKYSEPVNTDYMLKKLN